MTSQERIVATRRLIDWIRGTFRMNPVRKSGDAYLISDDMVTGILCQTGLCRSPKQLSIGAELAGQLSLPV
jgi:hypothetical protein